MLVVFNGVVVFFASKAQSVRTETLLVVDNLGVGSYRRKREC
jgi:hypothetical protein